MNTRQMIHTGIMFAALLLMFAVMAIAASPVHAVILPEDEPQDPENDIRIWHSVKMKPGSSYNCADAGWNTTVFISNPGDYTLSGKSSTVRVVIESGGVNLYLQDGLNLNCGMRSYAGTRTAAINIGLDSEPDGTVTLISKKNANIYFEGYMAPGIRKDGTKTALAFATEDPNNPGTIKAVGGKESAGIGGVMYVNVTPATTGNIQINSGNIEAVAGSNSAGIGGGSGGGVDNVTISGGSVKATGDSGAGIGGGSGAAATNITITGGNVAAYGSDSAGIGSGYGGDQTSVSIKGGTVYAEVSKESSKAYHAAIGGANGAKSVGVVIEGGDVTAIGSNGPGIGSGGTTLDDSVSIALNGGTIHAQSKNGSASAIGAAGAPSLDIRIRGGIIDATSTNGVPAIGSPGEYEYSGYNIIEFEGGTTSASNGADSDSFQIGFNGKGPVYIDGGSIFAKEISNVRFQDERAVHRLGIEFDGVSKDGLKVESMNIRFNGDSFDYGTGDIYTSHGGKIFLWMPHEIYSYITEIKLDGKSYSGEVSLASDKGTLHSGEGEAFTEGGVLLAKMTAKGKRSLVISWNEVAGAAGYEVFLGQCGDFETTEKCMLVTTVKTDEICKETMDGLKAKTAYRAYVKAYKTDLNGKKVYIEESPVIHAFTTGWTKTYTNPKSVTVKKTKLTLTAGKTAKIKASVTKVKKGKKLIPMTHAPKLRYLSSDEEIATVDGSGKIEAKAAGVCKIYVFAANGVSKAVNVTVK